MSITTREGLTGPETRQRGRYKVHRISKRAAAKKDNVQEVTAKEDPMEIEISEVFKLLRRPPPTHPVLEFIVSEDGYKKIIEEREKSKRK
ncbi:hypothetical protein V1504DRAFT_157191 [Lipomyces starkeyi]